MSEPWLIARSAYGFIQRTMKDMMLFELRPLRERLDRQRLLALVWNAGIREYNCLGFMASQWQTFNP
jgi:hypothetical protein